MYANRLKEPDTVRVAGWNSVARYYIESVLLNRPENVYIYIYDLMQKRRNSIAYALELRLFYIKP